MLVRSKRHHCSLTLTPLFVDTYTIVRWSPHHCSLEHEECFGNAGCKNGRISLPFHSLSHTCFYLPFLMNEKRHDYSSFSACLQVILHLHRVGIGIVH